MSNNTTNPRCGDCVNMREEDGYCGRVGRYVNYFRKACKDYVDRNATDTVKAAAPPAKPDTRTCKQCGRELPLEQFTRSCKSRDGYTHTCKECFSAQMSEKKKALWASKPKKEKPVQEQEVLPEGQKRCRRCGRILPVTAFGRHATTPDHLHPTCTECRKAEGRAVYERNCARKGVTPKPVKVEAQQGIHGTLAWFEDADLVAELRRRGWTITATKEL